MKVVMAIFKLLRYKLLVIKHKNKTGLPFYSLRYNSIVKSLQQGIQSFTSGRKSYSHIVNMKMNLKSTP